MTFYGLTKVLKLLELAAAHAADDPELQKALDAARLVLEREREILIRRSIQQAENLQLR